MRREAHTSFLGIAGPALILCAAGFALGCAGVATPEDPGHLEKTPGRPVAPPVEWDLLPLDEREQLPMELWWRPRNLVGAMGRARIPRRKRGRR